MSIPKRLLILWSKSAVTAAGADLAALQDRMTTEASEIAAQAQGALLHALAHGGDGACLVCNGRELPDVWKVFVQQGAFAPMAPIRKDDPDPALRGKVLKFPEASAHPDNEIFAAYSDISGGR